MKNILITFCLLSILTLTAQNKNTEKADNLFNQYEYVDAAKEYSKLLGDKKADPYIYKQLGDSYYNMFNSTEAVKWYAKAVQTPQEPETYFRYAQMLKSDGKYEAANKQLRQFATLSPNDQRAKAFLENPDYIPRLLDKEKLYEVFPTKFSSDKSDFGAVLHNSTIYFTSARNVARKTSGWNEEPFLDLYRGTYNADGTVTAVETVTELNSKYHDGPATISANGNTIYYTSDSFRENTFERDRKNNLKLGKNHLFRAVNENGQWTNNTSLPFNSADYSASNPSLSTDGKTLYFSSDKAGGYGGIDIWKVAVNDDGTFGPPENLGKSVNTEGNESFPFISEDNKVLFFASNGRQGFGGLDVFMLKLTGSSESVNLGKPVNTEKDDFAFTYNNTKKVGFLSSNRNGNDDIFLVNPICGVQVLAVVTNAKTGAILANAEVAILDDKNNVIATEKSNKSGEVIYRVECNKDHTIQASKEGFESNSFAVAKQDAGEKTIAAALQPIESIVRGNAIALNTIYFEYDRFNITREGAFELDKLVQVMNSNTAMVIMTKAHTDNRGSDSYNLQLSNRRAQAAVQYIISKGIAKERISGKGMGETEPIVNCADTCTDEQHAQNRRSEFLIVK